MVKNDNYLQEITKESELRTAAQDLLKKYPNVKIWLFEGQLGAGKTTFVKAFCEVLKVEDAVSSPTFALVNEYFSPLVGTVFHFDLYRCEALRDILRIGFFDYLENENYCFLEWANLVESSLDLPFIKISLSVLSDSSRMINIEKYG
jgi:tRNA threonylcarbamoyladenosine biosynthesis protein TsaE